MDNFDLRKFLIENKLTQNSKNINEFHPDLQDQELFKVNDVVQVVPDFSGKVDIHHGGWVKDDTRKFAGKIGRVIKFNYNDEQAYVNFPGDGNLYGFHYSALTPQKPAPINEGPELSLLSRAQELVGDELSQYIVPDSLEYEDYEEINYLSFFLDLPGGHFEAEEVAKELKRLSYNSGPGGYFLQVSASPEAQDENDGRVWVSARGGFDI